MSKRPRNCYLPLKNITSSFNSGNVFGGDGRRFSSVMDSPMTNLAFNLSELSTGRSTPRRKLSLSSASTPDSIGDSPDLECSQSLEAACGLWYPDREHSRLASCSSGVPKLGSDSKASENISIDSDKNVEEKNGGKLYLDDACSQDSGLGFEQDRRSSVSSFDDVGSISSSSSLNHLDRLPSLDDVWNSLDSPNFKTPKGKPPKRSRTLIDDKQFSEDACSPIKYSPVKSSSLPQPYFSKVLFSPKMPETENVVQTKNGGRFETDDGFQELFKLGDAVNEADDQLSSLISATLLHHPSEDQPDELTLKEAPNPSEKVALMFAAETETPLSRQTAARCALQRSQSLDIRLRPSSKRCEPSFDSSTPVQCKRWRGDEGILHKTDDNINDAGNKSICGRRLHRCHSETEAVIKMAISRMFAEPDLIGDCSKPYCLPTVSGRHQDLKSISPDTVSRLIAKEFTDVVEEFHIIDCRYPYEYEGGHIQNAVNVYTKEKVIERYMKSPLSIKDPNKRMILVFHCEFSSERGPGLFRFLRRQDRETNKERYPFLHYPEIYLLEGGYKNFFEHFSHLCEPKKYKTMFDKNHAEDLRKFRAKCKSWSEEKTQPRAGVRNLKF